MAENTNSQNDSSGGNSGEQTKRSEPLSALYAEQRALKRELKGLREDLAGLVAVGKRGDGFGISDEDDVESVRQKLIAKGKEIFTKEAEVDKRTQELSERERSFRAKELALEFGVSADELLDADDMNLRLAQLIREKVATEKAELQKQKEESENPVEKKPKRPPVDSGASLSSGSKKHVTSMTPDELRNYERELAAASNRRR